jgi:DNA-binding winged helix-turn-helix (wHTH) protein
VPRYRFGDFIVSPRRRMLVRGDDELPLIPRYFDLLVYLIEHRHEAVHRRDIFDHVWSDVVVSDSALSQAIRTIRRTLGDDSREPRFIRTISRHGYRFVYDGVAEEQDDGPWPVLSEFALRQAQGERVEGHVPSEPRAAAKPTPIGRPDSAPHDPFEPLLDVVTRASRGANDEEAQREAAELLHALGTAEALRRLGTRPGHAFARALLRDARWDSPQAGEVPLVGGPAPIATAGALVALRLRRAARIVAARWTGASIGGGVAGLLGGIVGASLLLVAPGSTAPFAVVPVLAAIGCGCGAAGGAAIGAGLSVAEVIARSWRALALVVGAAIAGSVAGAIVEGLARMTLAALVGMDVDTGGALDGLVVGATAGIGYAFATSRVEGGLAAPRGRGRVRVAALTALTCGLGALALSAAGRPLVGGTIHAIAQASQGSQAALTPLGRIIGEPDFGPITRALIGMGEGIFFGAGLSFGLTSRVRAG